MSDKTPKLRGKYIPCTIACDAPSPCYGCDSGDYEYPSIPGRPETYSPNYHYLHTLLRKNMHGEVLSPDEAEDVYTQAHALFSTMPEGGLLSCLLKYLTKEAVTGKRCSVCLKVEDSSCIEGC